MTWIYVPDSTFSTVSPAMAGSPLDSDSPTPMPTSGRSPISNGTNTASKSSANVSATDSWMTLPSGEETSSPSTDDPGVESWISSLRVRHAPPSRSPATALEERMTEICSRKRSDWLTRYDRPTSSWKMSQVSLWEDDPTYGTFSADFPRSGFMNADGTLYRLKMSRPLINGPAGGASPERPTPTPWEQQESIQSWTGRRERERAKGRNGNAFGIPLDMAARLWATPRVGDAKNNAGPSEQERHGPALNVQVKQMLPTPSASPSSFYAESDETSSKRPNSDKFLTLPRAVMLLPNGIRGGSWAKEKLVETFGEEDAVAMSGGSLSPDWVSWLMGLPVKWTSLEPLPREEYDQWLQMQRDGTWWAQWWGPWWFDCPSIATGIPDRVNRLKCLGNGIVPASLALFLRGTR